MECFPDRCLRYSFTANRKASTENQKFSSEDVEGFFRRAHALYVPKFPKNSAVSLTDLPELCLGLLRLCLVRSSRDAFVTETRTSDGKVSESRYQF